MTKKLYIFKIECYTESEEFGFRLFKEYKIYDSFITDSLKKDIEENIECVCDGRHIEVILPEYYKLDHYETSEKDNVSISKNIFSVLF